MIQLETSQGQCLIIIKKKRQKIISTILWATNKWVVNKKTINNHRTRTNTFWGFYFVTFLLLSILLLLRSSTLSCESSFRIVVGCVRWDKRDDWSYNLITCVTVQRCTQQQACKIYIQNSMILRKPKEKNVPFYFLMTKIPSIKNRFFSLSFQAIFSWDWKMSDKKKYENHVIQRKK